MFNTVTFGLYALAVAGGVIAAVVGTYAVMRFIGLLADWYEEVQVRHGR